MIAREDRTNEWVIVQSTDGRSVTFRYEEDRTNTLVTLPIDQFRREYTL
jgi:hypothetical protein